MAPILRSIGSVLLGLAVGFVVVVTVEIVDLKLYPFPLGLNPQDQAAMKEYMAHVPLAAMLIVLIGWALGALLGAWAAAMAARNSKVMHGMIVGIFLLGTAIANMLEFPHPIWFWICGLLVFLPSAYIGSRLAAPRGAHS